MAKPLARMFLRTMFVLLFSTAALASVACLSPTQGRIVVYTDMPCIPVDADLGRDALTDFRVYIAKDRQSLKAKLDRGTFDAQAACTGDRLGRRLGDIVVAGSGEVYIAVQGGLWPLGGSPNYAADCKVATDACVIVRRVLQYQPHQELIVPIALDASCTRVRCEEDQSCSNGRCESIPTITESAPPGLPPQELPPVPVRDAGTDTKPLDASSPPPDPMPRDASTDAEIGEVILDAAIVRDSTAPVADAQPQPATIPSTIAVCNNGLAGLSPYGTKPLTTACARTGGNVDTACVGPITPTSQISICAGTPDPTGLPATPPTYKVCCALQENQPCCAATLAGGFRVPVYSNGTDPNLKNCTTLQSARTKSGTPCFSDVSCVSQSCEFIVLPDGREVGYGFCK